MRKWLPEIAWACGALWTRCSKPASRQAAERASTASRLACKRRAYLHLNSYPRRTLITCSILLKSLTQHSAETDLVPRLHSGTADRIVGLASSLALEARVLSLIDSVEENLRA